MTNPDLTPPNIRRGVFRWIGLFLNGSILAGIAFAYPQLSTSSPALFTGNTAWLILTAWGIFLIIHVVVVCFLELRENNIIGRKQRAYERALGDYNRQKIKQRLEA